MHGLFVTGTDTGVGKTVVAAALLCRFHARYWKPIQTGIESDDDTAEIRRLTGKTHDRDEGVRLRNPVSPHLAAKRAGFQIDIEALAAWAPDHAIDDEDAWIVEGAGGVLVPVNETQTMANLMVRLGLPVVVVARTTLGTINHTLLTLEALRTRSLQIAGVVMVGEPNPDNRAAIERYGKTVVLGEMPPFNPLTPASLAEWASTSLDPEGRLQEFFE
jgi:dethiobiotin synthetase